MVACGGATSGDASSKPTQITVSWGERTCAGPYAEGPYPAKDVPFGSGRANIPVPPVFATASDAGDWPRTEVALDGSAVGAGAKIVSCNVTLEAVSRVTATTPRTVERDLTWTGTRSDPCNSEPAPAPSSCHVVQRIVYPVDARDAGP